MNFTIGLVLFVVLTLVLWWALKNQLHVGAEAQHAHHDH
jgi:hypothetical protein